MRLPHRCHRLFGSALLALQLSLGSASAHPHVFVDYAITLLFDDHGAQAVRVSWTFDEMYSSMLLHDYTSRRWNRANRSHRSWISGFPSRFVEHKFWRRDRQSGLDFGHAVTAPVPPAFRICVIGAAAEPRLGERAPARLHRLRDHAPVRRPWSTGSAGVLDLRRDVQLDATARLHEPASARRPDSRRCR